MRPVADGQSLQENNVSTTNHIDPEYWYQPKSPIQAA